jgi:hypothetical protein
MAKPAEQKDATVEALTAKVAESQQLTVTPDLVALIAAAVAAAVKEAGRDEDKEAAKARAEADREVVRREEEQRLANIIARQAACPHLDAYENYAFCGQRNCMGQYVFLCSQCFKPFTPGDPEYNNYVRFIKWERMGQARQ